MIFLIMSAAQHKPEENPRKKSIKLEKKNKNNSSVISLSNGTETITDIQTDFHSNKSHNQYNPNSFESKNTSPKVSKIKELMNEKNCLLEVISSNQKEIEFLNLVINQFVDLNELIKIRQSSAYDESSKT